MRLPEQFRLTAQLNEKMKLPESLVTSSWAPEGGFFILPPLNGTKDKTNLFCIASTGIGWDHVSVSPFKAQRTPTWEEMCYVKSQFWDDEEAVMQLHPPRSTWVNNHPYVLHLWLPQNSIIPLPPPVMVGTRSKNVDKNATTL